MSWNLYAAFVVASTVLIIVPGPAVSLVIAESLRHGRRAGLAAIAGLAAATAVQMLLVVIGLAALLDTVSSAYLILKWAGVLYLFWLGIEAIRGAGRAPADEPAPSAARSVWRGVLVALSNPKTLVFFAAFLPVFVDTSAPVWPQLFLLGGTFIAIAVICDSGWVLFAGSMRALLRRTESRAWLERGSGLVMIGGATWLALKRA